MIRFALGQLRNKDSDSILALLHAVLEDVRSFSSLCLAGNTPRLLRLPVCVVKSLSVPRPRLLPIVQLHTNAAGKQELINAGRDTVKWLALTFGPISEKDRFRKAFVDIHKCVLSSFVLLAMFACRTCYGCCCVVHPLS